MSSPRHSRIRRLITRLEDFSRFGIGIPLRPYQQEVAAVSLVTVLNWKRISSKVLMKRAKIWVLMISFTRRRNNGLDSP
jgi:hypothetical protein